MDMLKYVFETNLQLLVFLLMMGCLIGLVLAFMTLKINREKTKKSFSGRFKGLKDKSVDKKLYEDYKEAKRNDSLYTAHDVEHHASKKFN